MKVRDLIKALTESDMDSDVHLSINQTRFEKERRDKTGNPWCPPVMDVKVDAGLVHLRSWKQ